MPRQTNLGHPISHPACLFRPCSEIFKNVQLARTACIAPRCWYTYCLLLLLAHRSDGSFYALWFLARAAFWCLFAPPFAHARSQRGDIVVFPEYRNKHPVMWRPASHGFNKLTTQPNPPHSLELGSIRAHLVRAPTIPLAGGSVIGRTSRLPGPAGIYLCGHEDGCLVL